MATLLIYNDLGEHNWRTNFGTVFVLDSESLKTYKNRTITDDNNELAPIGEMLAQDERNYRIPAASDLSTSNVDENAFEITC